MAITAQLLQAAKLQWHFRAGNNKPPAMALPGNNTRGGIVVTQI